MLDKKAIRGLCERATPGPWVWNNNNYRGGFSGITGADNAEVLSPNHCNDGDDGDAWFEELPSQADAELIAQSREIIPALLDELEAVQNEMGALYWCKCCCEIVLSLPKKGDLPSFIPDCPQCGSPLSARYQPKGDSHE